MLFKRFVILLLTFLLGTVGSAFAQEPRQLQAALESLWEPPPRNGRASSENMLDIAADALLTAEAEDFRRQWAIEDNDNTATCQRRSAAAHFGFGYTLEFLDTQEILYLVGFEQVRRVYMDGRDPPNNFWPNKLGWSKGHWDGNTLVVRTNDFTQGTIDTGNRPLPFGGPDAEMIERYTLSDDLNTLSLHVTRIDAKYYIAPIEMHHTFIRSNRTIFAIDCVPSIY